MTVRVFRGYAPDVAEVQTFTVAGTWVAGDEITLSLNGKDVVVTVGSAVAVADVVAAIVAGWNGGTMPDTSTVAPAGDTIPEFDEITASGTASPVTLTHDTAGVPFNDEASSPASYLTAATDSSAGTVGSVAIGTAATGAEFWDNAANWSGDTVPITGDDVELRGDVSIRYGIDQISGSPVILAMLRILANFTGDIGLPRENDAGATSYVEYRGRYLQIGATKTVIGEGAGDGSSRIMLDSSTLIANISVLQTGTSSVDGEQAVMWKGTHASNAVEVFRGEVGIATADTSETAAFIYLRVGSVTNTLSDATVSCGVGAVLKTCMQYGGSIIVRNTDTAVITIDDGHMVVSAAHTNANDSAITQNGGTLEYMSSQTLQGLIVGNGAVADFSAGTNTRAISTCTLQAGGEIIDPNASVTWGSGINVPSGQITLTGDVKANLGYARNVVVQDI